MNREYTFAVWKWKSLWRWCDVCVYVCLCESIFARCLHIYLNFVFKQVIIYQCGCIQSDRFYETWGINPMGKRTRAMWHKKFEYINVCVYISEFEALFCHLHTYLSFSLLFARSRCPNFETMASIWLDWKTLTIVFVLSVIIASWTQCVHYVCRLHSLIPRD